jgi:hypothetical protein
MSIINIGFEDGANFITARGSDGEVLIRCNVQYTDCRDDEALDEFIGRHGGEVRTTSYLRESYSAATSLR